MSSHKNEAARNRLVGKIAAIPGALPLKLPLPVISVRDFMDGNDDRDSLAVNQLDSLEAFRALRAGLIALADAPGVLAVLVEVYEMMHDTWPFSERVYVVVAADAAREVRGRCEALEVSDIGEGWIDETPPGAPDFTGSHRVLSLWWD